MSLQWIEHSSRVDLCIKLQVNICRRGFTNESRHSSRVELYIKLQENTYRRWFTKKSMYCRKVNLAIKLQVNILRGSQRIQFRLKKSSKFICVTRN